MMASPPEHTSTFLVPEDELAIRASRSGGPGGQHVNTSSSRIEVVWDIASSPSLNPRQRDRLLQRLAHRLDSHGRLRVVAQDERSQLRNRELAIARLRDVVAQALVIPKVRKRTRPTATSRRERLDTKRKRGAIKKMRRPPAEE